MISFILTMLNGITSFMMRFLPLSPIQQYYANNAMQLEVRALGWLNWFVPIQDMLGIFTLWLTAGLIYATVNYLLRNTLGVVTDMGMNTGS